MPRYVVLACFFAAGAYAERIAMSYAEHKRHTDEHMHDLHLQPIPIQTVATYQSAQQDPTAQVDVHGGSGPYHLPQGGSMKDPAYHVNLPGDWKSGNDDDAAFVLNENVEREPLARHVNGAPIVKPSLQRAIKSNAPPRIAVDLGKLIDDWGESASREWLDADKVKADGSLKAIEAQLRKLDRKSFLMSLKQMSDDIERNAPIHVFGLGRFFDESTGKMPPESIQAMASVEMLTATANGDVVIGNQKFQNSNSTFGVVHINCLFGKGQGVGVVGSPERELLIQIIDWATEQGNVVSSGTLPSDGEINRIYQEELGFEYMPTAHGALLIYAGGDPREAEPRKHGLLVDLIDREGSTMDVRHDRWKG